MTTKPTVKSILTTLVLAWALLGVLAPRDAHAIDRMRVGYLPISAAIPLYVALERGLFTQEAIEVEAVKYQNGALMAEDVITGRLDAASPGPADVYLNNESKTPGRFLIYLQTAYTPDNFVYSLLVRRDSKIKSSGDLKGKRIAVFPGVTNKLLFGLYLQKKHGWNPDKDVSIAGVAANVQLDALETGEVDALSPLEPMGTIGASRPALEMIERGPVEREVVNPLYITAHCLSNAFASKRSDTAQRFVRAMEKAVDIILEHESEARQYLPRYTPLNADLAVKTPLGNILKTNETDLAKFQELADLLAASGVLPGKIDVAKLYYRSP